MKSHSRNESRTGKAWTIGLLLLVLGFALSVAVNLQRGAKSKLPEELQDILLSQPQELPAFQLLDQQSAPFTKARLQGQWTFLVFGYTNCPDICPTTLAEMDDLVQLLARENQAPKNVQTVLVTVDPKRDTAKEMSEYLGYFNKDFIGLTGEVDKIVEFCKPLGIHFSYEEYAPGQYAVNHSSAVILLDPQGRYRARFPAPHYAMDLRDLFLKITQIKS